MRACFLNADELGVECVAPLQEIMTHSLFHSADELFAQFEHLTKYDNGTRIVIWNLAK